jgi:mannose-6-phosphate isomerase-like protein (cupin superfamily)
MEALKDASHLYEAEHRATHAARPGFRISELKLSAKQKVPWHYHNNVADTFYVLEGVIRIFMQAPKEEVRLAAGETWTVPARRPHLVTNGGAGGSATFLVLQGMGEYDFVPLVGERSGRAED